MSTKRGLGKGLQALIPSIPPEGEEEFQGSSIKNIPLKDIKPNTYQPRKEFSQERLEELAQSIKENGLIQPIVVRLIGEGKYQLIAGERRWRACALLEQETIPAVIKDLDDRQTTELALIENIQREDLNPIEEAWAYKTLLEEFGITHSELSTRLGRSRPSITNTLRLLNLECDAQDALAVGLLSMGHARALLGLTDGARQKALAQRIIEEGLSVRQTEKAVKALLETKEEGHTLPAKQAVTPIIAAIQERLEERLGTKVKVKHGEERGHITIDYYGDQDLNRILEILGVED